MGQKPPLRLEEIWGIRIRLQLAKRARELALFNLALDSKLRGCNLVSLRVGDVAQGSRVSARASALGRKADSLASSQPLKTLCQVQRRRLRVRHNVIGIELRAEVGVGGEFGVAHGEVAGEGIDA